MQTKRNYMAEKQNLQLSIIVPVYGVEKYIRPCIDSIFCQGLDEKCYEVIIVNDGTKDRSMEIIQDIIDIHDNITIVNQENHFNNGSKQIFVSFMFRNLPYSYICLRYLYAIVFEDRFFPFYYHWLRRPFK